MLIRGWIRKQLSIQYGANVRGVCAVNYHFFTESKFCWSLLFLDGEPPYLRMLRGVVVTLLTIPTCFIRMCYLRGEAFRGI
jgi:hypothetical protein